MDDSTRAFPGARNAATHSVEVRTGHKVVVVSNLLLPRDPTEESLRAANLLGRQLDEWVGGGMLLVTGTLFDSAGRTATNGVRGEEELGAIESHSDFFEKLRRFAAGGRRRVIILRGTPEDEGQTNGATPGASGKQECHEGHEGDPTIERLCFMGLEVMPVADLVFHTANGNRQVHVEAGPAALASVAGGLPGEESPGSHPDQLYWGVSRLSDPDATKRFVLSRLVYRRLSKYAWVLLLPILVAVALKVPLVVALLAHALRSHPAPRKVVMKVYRFRWGVRLATAAGALLVEIAVFAGATLWLTGKVWKTIVSGTGNTSASRLSRKSASLPSGIGGVNDQRRSYARWVVADGYEGFITGSSIEPELSYLGADPDRSASTLPGERFFACPGSFSTVTHEHPARFGLPPVFVDALQASWIELEGGAELRVRLFMGSEPVRSAYLLERILPKYSGCEPARHPEIAAAWSSGPAGPAGPTGPEGMAGPAWTTWPRGEQAMGALKSHRNAARVRRSAAVAIGIAGLTDFISGVVPPLRERMHVVLQVLPLVAAQAAGALIVLAGLSLLALARGIRRGQKNAYRIAVMVLAVSLAFHLIRGGGLIAMLLTAAVLVLLVLNRSSFRASMGLAYIQGTLLWILGGCLSIVVAATAVVVYAPRVDSDGSHHGLSVIAAFEAVTARLAGVHEIMLPHRLDSFLSPALLATGFALVVTLTWVITRPVLSSGMHLLNRNPEMEATRARNIVGHYGGGTLDFFALRDDKSWFFFRNSVIAYGVISGVCVISPDPIGPYSERELAWQAFKQMADRHGWVIAIIGASEEWLPIYQHTGMRYMYIGDEGIVNVQQFSLKGNSMKGLRQAYNRIHNKGYRATLLELSGGKFVVRGDTAADTSGEMPDRDETASEDARAGTWRPANASTAECPPQHQPGQQHQFREEPSEDGGSVGCSTLRGEIQPLLEASRKGDVERGFSMMLGRICDSRDEGTLICIVKDSQGNIAALCHFVPASAVNGYSLDLMRWDKEGGHPNGLIDFALCSTIFHLAGMGKEKLSLNFAAMRAVFDKERGSGASKRFQYWAYKRMSNVMQMESLLKFNAKYRPEWYPRYVVFDSPEYALPIGLACFRAEALVDFPVVGKIISAANRHAAERPAQQPSRLNS
ncbi:MAG: bifunctional lysylphosphatidylglycerol flippase/synthetase MprF [Acidimicrobiales bacterium]